MNLLKCFFLLSIITIISGIERSAAQDLFSDDTGVNNQYWVDFIPHFRINDKLEFYGDASFRVRDNGQRKILTVRPSLRWQIGPIMSLHGGLGLFYNIYSEEDNILEVRPWQGLRIAWPDIRRLYFKHYIRLEQRYYPSLDNLLIYRARYKLSVKVPLNKKVVQVGAIFIPAGFEWLGQSDDDFDIMWASETRLTIGLGYVYSKDWQFEFEYMNWWTKDLPNQEFQRDQQVFRLKLIKSGWVFGE